MVQSKSSITCGSVPLELGTSYTSVSQRTYSFLHSFIHSFIPDIYIAPLQETYSEGLSVQLRSKRNVLRSLTVWKKPKWWSKWHDQYSYRPFVGSVPQLQKASHFVSEDTRVGAPPSYIAPYKYLATISTVTITIITLSSWTLSEILIERIALLIMQFRSRPIWVFPAMMRITHFRMIDLSAGMHSYKPKILEW